MKQKDILFLLIPVTLLVIAWIVFNIYHNSATSTISESLSTNILPISPNFDIKTISNLKEREKVVPAFEFRKAEAPTPTPTPTPTPNLIPSPSLNEPTTAVTNIAP